MPESVDSRHLLLIGAGPGVGASVARRFGREGFRSTLISRGETLEKLAAELRGDGLETEAVVADIEDLDGYRASLERIFGAPGAPGVVVYNAALPDPGEILDTTVGRLRIAYDVDVLGAVVAAQVAVPVLRSAGSGTLLFTSGGFADHPMPAVASLSMGKAALGGDPDRRRCPRGRHPCRDRHDRRLGRAWDAFDPDNIAELFWTAHTDPIDAWQTEYRFTGA
ncbi:MAG TPA: SDR family NAD(P)-dependent oxidoreductase [Solirubrobacteraceae bacterium]|nr:SDR family NAD(P)-dependent oxidoreductase [Solirubrobacteraceae bacterium]